MFTPHKRHGSPLKVDRAPSTAPPTPPHPTPLTQLDTDGEVHDCVPVLPVLVGLLSARTVNLFALCNQSQ